MNIVLSLVKNEKMIKKNIFQIWYKYLKKAGVA